MDLAQYSEIAKSASIKSPELTEHPVSVGPRCEVHDGASIGAYTFINIGTVVYRNVEIGRYTSFARNCEIGVANHPTQMLSTHSFQFGKGNFPRLPSYDHVRRTKWTMHSKTRIGSDVWIGAQTIVKAGVTIGDGAVIAANSVVTKDIEPYAIVGGSPAKHIRYRFDPQYIGELLNYKWWNMPYEAIKDLPFEDVPACIEQLRKMRGGLTE